MRKLQDAKFNLSFPLFAKDYPEYTELRDLMKKADGLHSKLVEKIRNNVAATDLSADKLIFDLFEKAKNIATDNDIYLKALKRVRLGNPPGKESSMGDAVNWECLLKEVPNGEDIYIVSGDKDFRSPLEDDIDEFLSDEWADKKLSTLFFYTKISDFFKDRFPNIKIASEIERDLLIQRLAQSGSFAKTHLIIAKLANQPEFSPTQVEQLTEIPETNNQVGWIVGDDDVHAFYKRLLDEYGDQIQQDAAKKLAEIVGKGEPASGDEAPDF